MVAFYIFPTNIEKAKEQTKNRHLDPITEKKRLLEIIEEGGNVMSNLEEFLRKVIRENAEKGRAEGRSQGILQVAKEMVKSKVSDEDIIKYTHLSKKELQELKLQMA